MDKTNYIEKLRIAIIKNKYDKTYENACLDYAQKLLDNNLPVIFDKKHFALLLGIDYNTLCTYLMISDEVFYKEFYIAKKSNGYRKIEVPCITIKYIQRWILDNILSNVKVSGFCHGFVKGKSIVTNAKMHINKQCVMSFDLKDFFPSIEWNMIFRLFVYYGYTKEVAFLLTKICTFANELPQGSPASPMIANIVALKLDKRLSKLAEKYNATYTRYADDLTFSGDEKIKNLKPYILKIIEDEGFHINKEKTRILYAHQRQEVTGLIVNNDKVRVNRKYKKDFLKEIYFCKKYGFESHLKRTMSNKAFYKEHMYGKAFFINMVEPNEGKKLFNLLNDIDWGY